MTVLASIAANIRCTRPLVMPYISFSMELSRAIEPCCVTLSAFIMSRGPHFYNLRLK
jgi:hypothetical protein